MSDEESKQLLRDILAAQKAQLEYLQRQDRTYVEHSQEYEKTSALYRQALQARPWEMLIRAITVLGIVVILGYLVLRGI